MKAIKKTFAVILCMLMTLSMFSVMASAEVTTTPATIDTSKKGSITIYKYEYNGAANAQAAGTGETQTPPDGSTALSGVTFDLYKVMNDTQLLTYYDGTAANSATVEASNFISEGKVYDYDNRTSHATELTNKTTRVTGADGKVEFTNLDLGMYLVIESNYPSKVTEPAAPFLVSVPMTQASNLQNWLYDITVYPKNKTSVGNVTLTKKDGTNLLEGVSFKLEQKTGDTSWTNVIEGQTTTQNTNASGVVSWNNLVPGTYRITEQSTLKGYIADKRPIQFTVNTDNTISYTSPGYTGLSGSASGSTLSLELQNYKPDLTKTITTTGNADNGKTLSANIGDEVAYNVAIDVPANITNLTTFTLTDTPTNLQYKANTLSITYATADEGKKTLTEGTHYTITTPEKENGKGFIVTFKNAQMSDYAGKTINVAYTATVLNSAKDAIAAPNTATLTYSNNIYPETAPGETPPSDTQYNIKDGAVVYTYQLGLTKYKDSIAAGNLAPGVEFELYSAVTGGTAIGVIPETSGVDGVYYYTTDSSATGKVTTLKTDSNGKIVVKGLKNGTYYLQETKTVTGYNLLKGRVSVPLTISTTTTWATDGVTDTITKKVYSSATYTSADDDATTTSLYNVNVINKKGLQLPQTGGIGTAMFIVLGGVLIAVGSYMLFVRGKKHNSDI